MAPAGRPPLRGKSSMGRMLRVRLTEDEWVELAALAFTAGLAVSEYVREMVLVGGVPGVTRHKTSAKLKKKTR